MKENLRFRQVHLDFHTSPKIPKIGGKFNKELWQETLKKGHVDSITLFATCHHGWSYYDTEIGKQHPELNFNLLKSQYEASKEIDVNVPIYLTAGVHNMMAEKNPQWREINKNGEFAGWTTKPLSPGFKTMCFNSPYLDYLCDQISEVVTLFPDCDGIFLDIIHQGECCCQYCLDSMQEKGFDPEKDEDIKAHALQVLENYYSKTTVAATDKDADMRIFHNSGHITRGDRDILKYFSHLELESLPTGGWGYDHFPISAKYCKKLDKDFLGMTGKFHTTWGEFGGVKHPNALRYECAAMLAFGSKCSIGDQLHPNASLDESTYDIIGAAYKEVEEKEAWCKNTINVVDIAVLSSDAVNKTKESASDTGVCRILLENQYLFDLIDAEMEFDIYKLLILPDDIKISKDLKGKLDIYLGKGGKLLLSGDSGLNKEGTEFLFDIGATFEGKNNFEPDYLMASEKLQPSFSKSPLVMYCKSNKIQLNSGISLGKVCNSYFNRAYNHFCSHQHTPYNLEDAKYDSGVIKGNILYLAHPIFSIYRGLGAVSYKEYAINAIDMLLGSDKSLITNMPSTARVSLMDQKKENCSILHLLYANTINRGGEMQMSGGNLDTTSKSVEVIEELLPLYETNIKLKLTKKVKKVTLQPQNKEIKFNINNEYIEFNIDKFICHQMIVLDY